MQKAPLCGAFFRLPGFYNAMSPKSHTEPKRAGVPESSVKAAQTLHAQTTRVLRVAIAMPIAREIPHEGINACRQRMTELGWTESHNIAHGYGYANDDARRYEPVIAGQLAQKPSVLFAYFHPMALIAKNLAQQVPIVFAISSVPEESGLVASLGKTDPTHLLKMRDALASNPTRADLVIDQVFWSRCTHAHSDALSYDPVTIPCWRK
jgi:hypothetical protein